MASPSQRDLRDGLNLIRPLRKKRGRRAYRHHQIAVTLNIGSLSSRGNEVVAFFQVVSPKLA